jgi:hypothetical protein
MENLLKQNNFLLKKIKQAIKKKYTEVRSNKYGIQNEPEVIDFLHQKIERRLSIFLFHKAHTHNIDS